MREIWVWSLGWADPMEEGMATHSSILVWRIPMDRGAWQATVHGVAKSRTQLNKISTAQPRVYLRAGWGDTGKITPWRERNVQTAWLKTERTVDLENHQNSDHKYFSYILVHSMMQSVPYYSICQSGDLWGFREVSLSGVKGLMYYLTESLYSFK